MKYFKHSTSSRNGQKMLSLRMVLGVEGYGIYYMLLEKLSESEGNTLPMDYAPIAFELQVPPAKVQQVVEDFGLFSFTEDGKSFYCEQIVREMAAQAEKSEKTRASINKRWERYYANIEKGYERNTNEVRTNNERNTNVIRTYNECITNEVQEYNERIAIEENTVESISEEASEGNAEVIRTNNERNTNVIRTYNECMKGVAGAELKEENSPHTPLKEENIPLKEKLPKGSKKKIPPLGGESKPDEAKTQKRKDAFYQSLVPYVERYGKEMIRAFFDYWSEMNKSKTKMRWENETTWETGRRLARWANNQNTYGNTKQQQIQTTEPQRATLSYIE